MPRVPRDILVFLSKRLTMLYDIRKCELREVMEGGEWRRGKQRGKVTEKSNALNF